MDSRSHSSKAVFGGCASKWARVAAGQRASIVMGFLGIFLASCGEQKRSATPASIPEAENRVSALAVIERPLPASSGSSEAGKDKNKTRLPVYELKIRPKDLQDLERTAFSNQTVPATFMAKGQIYEGVRVRYRGQWARTWPKKGFKIFFDHDKLFDGERCLNLNSGWRDPAFVREHLAYEVYAASGVPSPASRMVRLELNGRFRGLYVEVEQPDKGFLLRQNLRGAGLFKAISTSNRADERDLGREESFARHYERATKKAEGLRDLQLFCHELAQATNTLEFFTRRVDLDKYINYLAVGVLVQHWDCFNKKHFLACASGDVQKWFVIPWDLDRTFGDHWRGGFDYAQFPVLLGTRELPGTTGWNRMEDRFFSDPVLRSRFLERLGELLTKEFTPEKLFPALDRLESEIGPEAKMDRERWPSSSSDLHRGVAQLKNYITQRRAYLLDELPRLKGK